MSYFPMFVELDRRPCLVVGGGKVAFRKIQVLKEFGAEVTVVAPCFIAEIQCIEDIVKIPREFQPGDLNGMRLVVAATDDKERNHTISQACHERNIPVNAVDQIEDCSFIFPSYVKQGEVVAAFSSGGNSPVVTQYLKRQMQPILTEHLGEMAEYLGSLRECVKKLVPTEVQRKRFYQEVLALGLEKNGIPDKNEIQEILDDINNKW